MAIFLVPALLGLLNPTRPRDFTKTTTPVLYRIHVNESKLDTVEFTEVCVGAPTSSHLDVYDCFLLDVGDELYVRLVKHARA